MSRGAGYNPDALSDKHMWGAKDGASQFWGAGKSGRGAARARAGIWQPGMTERGVRNPVWWGRGGKPPEPKLVQAPQQTGPELLEPGEDCPIHLVLEKRFDSARRAEYKVEWKDDRKENGWVQRDMLMRTYLNTGAINQYEIMQLEEIKKRITELVEASMSPLSWREIAKNVRSEHQRCSATGKVLFSFGHLPIKVREEDGYKSFIHVIKLVGKEKEWEIDIENRTCSSPAAMERKKAREDRGSRRSRSWSRGRRRERSRERYHTGYRSRGYRKVFPM